jgi:hypothetical protein
MRKILSIAAAVLGAAIIARAANVPFVTGPLDPGNAVGNANQLIQNINTYAPGIVAVQPGPIADIASTVEYTFVTTTVPTGTLTAPGQALRITCSGITSSDSNTKTAKLYWGTGVSITTGAFSTGGSVWELQLLVMAATSPVTANTVYNGHSIVSSASGVAMASGGIPNVLEVGGNDTNSVDNLNTGVPVKCTGTNGATASTADMIMEQLVIEQVK